MFLKVCSLIVLCDYMPIFACKLAFNQNDIFPVITTRIRLFFQMSRMCGEARARHGLVSVCSEVVEYLGGAVMVRVFFCKFA